MAEAKKRHLPKHRLLLLLLVSVLKIKKTDCLAVCACAKACVHVVVKFKCVKTGSAFKFRLNSCQKVC